MPGGRSKRRRYGSSSQQCPCCNNTFHTERGLNQHIINSASCKNFYATQKCLVEHENSSKQPAIASLRIAAITNSLLEQSNEGDAMSETDAINTAHGRKDDIKSSMQRADELIRLHDAVDAQNLLQASLNQYQQNDDDDGAPLIDYDSDPTKASQGNPDSQNDAQLFLKLDEPNPPANSDSIARHHTRVKAAIEQLSHITGTRKETQTTAPIKTISVLPQTTNTTKTLIDHPAVATLDEQDDITLSSMFDVDSDDEAENPHPFSDHNTPRLGNNLTDQEIRALSTHLLPATIHQIGNYNQFDCNKVLFLPTDLPKVWNTLNDTVPHTPGDKSKVRLLELMLECDAPHNKYPSFMKWAHDLKQYDIMRPGTHFQQFKKSKRSKVIKRLSAMFPIPKFSFRTVPVENKFTKEILNGYVWFKGTAPQQYQTYEQDINRYNPSKGSSITSCLVPHSNLIDQLKSMLNDRDLFGDLDLLNINVNNFPDRIFQPYVSNDHNETIDEIMSASWYSDTVRRKHLGPNDFLFPIILYLDKTGTDGYSRYGLEPVIMTTALFKRALRNKDHAWVTIGFIPDLELRSKSEKQRDRVPLMKGSSNRNYQSLLRVILSDFVQYQGSGFEHCLVLGPYAKKVNIIPEICCIMGDGKSGDCLTGRYATHQFQVQRQCRSCWTMYDDLDRTDTETCQWICSYQTYFPTVLAYADGVLRNERVALVAPPTNAESSTAFGPKGDTRTTESSDEETTFGDVELPTSTNTRQQCTGEHITHTTLPSNRLLEENPLLNHNHVMALLHPGRPHTDQADDQLSRTDIDRLWTMYRQEYENPEAARIVLQKTCQHQSILAFHEISFGGDLYGVHGLTPTDGLHSIKLGLWRYIARYVVGLFTPKCRAELDLIAHNIIRPQRQYEARYYPRWNFSHGVTSLTRLTADEWGGVILTLIILFELPIGRHLCLVGQTNKDDHHDVSDLVMTLEQILCFHAWWSFGPFWKNGDRETEKDARSAISIMMDNIKNHIKRSEGNGWKLAKFHEMLHIPRDISRLGAPLGFDSYVGERLLKVVAKKPAKAAQMRGYHSFIEQVAHRTEEQRVIQRSSRMFDSERHDQYDAIVNRMMSLKQTRSEGNEISGADTEDVIDDHDSTVSESDEEECNETSAGRGVNEARSMDDKSLRRLPLWRTTMFIHFYNQSFQTTGLNFQTTDRTFRLSIFEESCRLIYVSIMKSLQKLMNGVAKRTENSTLLPQETVFVVIINCYSELLVRNSYVPGGKPKSIYHCRYDDIVQQDGLVVRCHPNYHQDGEWNDWILVAPGVLPKSAPTSSGYHVVTASRAQFKTKIVGDHGSSLCGIPGKVHAVLDFYLEPLSSQLGNLVPGTVDGYPAISCISRDARIGTVLLSRSTQLAVLVHAASSYVSSTVITERWMLKFETKERQQKKRASKSSVDETNKVYRPIFDLVDASNIVDRAPCFTQSRNIVEELIQSEYDERNMVVVLLNREEAWSRSFFEC